MTGTNGVGETPAHDAFHARDEPASARFELPDGVGWLALWFFLAAYNWTQVAFNSSSPETVSNWFYAVAFTDMWLAMLVVCTLRLLAQRRGRWRP